MKKSARLPPCFFFFTRQRILFPFREITVYPSASQQSILLLYIRQGSLGFLPRLFLLYSTRDPHFSPLCRCHFHLVSFITSLSAVEFTNAAKSLRQRRRIFTYTRQNDGETANTVFICIALFYIFPFKLDDLKFLQNKRFKGHIVVSDVLLCSSNVQCETRTCAQRSSSSIYIHTSCVCVCVCVQRVFIAAGMLHALPFTKRNSVESPSDTKTSASLYYASAEMERRSGEGSHVSL